MPTPLEVYTTVAKEFDITDEKNVVLEARLGFAREQAQQMQAIINRLIYDITTSILHMDAAQDASTKDAYRKKRDDYQNDLRQTSSALDIALVLVKEFEDALGEK